MYQGCIGARRRQFIQLETRQSDMDFVPTKSGADDVHISSFNGDHPTSAIRQGGGSFQEVPKKLSDGSDGTWDGKPLPDRDM